VPGDWNGERLAARVKLSPTEIAQAQKATIVKNPFIILSQGLQRNIPTAVRITLPPEGQGLMDYIINNPTLSIAKPPTLENDYQVEIIEYQKLIGTSFTIRATEAAKQAYEGQNRALMTLHIRASDTTNPEEVKTRPVVYNFPEEYVRKDEIKLKNPQDAAVAKFRLIPRVASTPAAPAEAK
jgi:hypothetical protein